MPGSEMIITLFFFLIPILVFINISLKINKLHFTHFQKSINQGGSIHEGSDLQFANVFDLLLFYYYLVYPLFQKPLVHFLDDSLSVIAFGSPSLSPTPSRLFWTKPEASKPILSLHLISTQLSPHRNRERSKTCHVGQTQPTVSLRHLDSVNGTHWFHSPKPRPNSLRSRHRSQWSSFLIWIATPRCPFRRTLISRQSNAARRRSGGASRWRIGVRGMRFAGCSRQRFGMWWMWARVSPRLCRNAGAKGDGVGRVVVWKVLEQCSAVQPVASGSENRSKSE